MKLESVAAAESIATSEAAMRAQNDPDADVNDEETGEMVKFKLQSDLKGVSIVPVKSPGVDLPVLRNGNANNANHNADEEEDDGEDDDAAAATAAAVAPGEFVPPDGGCRAWMVMLSAFLCNSILFGIINTYGSIYLTLQERMKESGEKDASSKAALVGSLTIGTTFLLSTLSGILTDQIGVRNTTFIGGLLAVSGLFLSALFVNNISVLFFTYGIMFGLGAALAYTPSLSILGHYFKRYLGLANGFVTAGSSASTALLPFFLNYMISGYGLEWTFCVLGCFTLFIIVSAPVYKPLRPKLEPTADDWSGGGECADEEGAAAAASATEMGAGTTAAVQKRRAKCGRLLRSLVNVENWRKPRYVIWAVSIPVALIGYFVPYVHTPKLVRDTFPGANENTPIMCIGMASGIGRLVCGFLADRPGVNRIYLQQCSFVAIGALTMLIPLTRSYELLLAICTAMGLFDGCFISLLGPVAYEICGPHGATQAIGFLLGLCSIPLTVGPPIAGMLYDQTNSYTLSYVLSGIPPMIGAAMMCTMRFVTVDGKEERADGEAGGGGGSLVEGGKVLDAEEQLPLARQAWKYDPQLLADHAKITNIACNGNGTVNGVLPNGVDHAKQQTAAKCNGANTTQAPPLKE